MTKTQQIHLKFNQIKTKMKNVIQNINKLLQSALKILK